MPTPMLSLKAINRATLARQMLLRPAEISALEAVRRLGGLQAQAPVPPYFALYARVKGFRPDDLADLLLGRQVARIVLMRGTVHLVTAEDALAWRPLVQPLLDRDLRTNQLHAAKVAGLDHARVADVARELLAGKPHTAAELGKALALRWPEREPQSLTHLVRGLLPLVQVPPRGLWGRSGQPTYQTADDWLGAPIDPKPSAAKLVERYLGAFGPASVADAQAWAGITKLGEVFEGMELMRFRGPDGRELFDLPDAPRPDPDTPAPPRLIGPFDQLVLSYADRSRIIDDAARKRVITQNGLVKGLLLAGGRVRGHWELKKATLVLTPYEKIAKRDLEGLERAGARLLAWAEPDAESHDVQVERWPEFSIG